MNVCAYVVCLGACKCLCMVCMYVCTYAVYVMYVRYVCFCMKSMYVFARTLCRHV